MKKSNFLIFLTLLIFPVTAFSDAKPEFPPGMSSTKNNAYPMAENGRYMVRQKGEGKPWYDPKKGGRVKYTFSVKDKVNGHEGMLILDNQTSRLKSLYLFGDRLIITGEEATAGAAVITIIDLESGFVLDTLMGYDPVPSPSGRFLVLRKFFSKKAAAPPKQSDLVLVYDLERSTEGNRMKGLSTYRNNTIGLLTEVGRPVFPMANARKKRYRVWVREESKRHRILPGGFFWLKGDKRLAFIDRMGQSFRLIVIDHEYLETEPKIHSADLDPVASFEEDHEKSDAKTGEHSDIVPRFHLDKVLTLESGTIQVHLSDRDGEDQVWEVPLQAFEPTLSD